MRKGMICLVLSVFLLAGCADGSGTEHGRADKGGMDAGSMDDVSANEEDTTDENNTGKVSELPDGTYTAEFHTDSGMFHVSEACDGMGTLTVEDGVMTIHISLASKNIVNLYPGLAKDAKEDGAGMLHPTEDTVTYDDGMTDEVYGFDVPVPALNEEFDLALIGTKGKWYDHKVRVSLETKSK